MTVAEREKQERHAREYDAFGPWILPVRNPDEVPDCFAGVFSWNESVEGAYKIPRKVDRRNARPGSDLYDFLIVLYAKHLDLFDRVAAAHVSVRYGEIIGTAKSIDLLKGTLSFFLADRTVSIPFNSVSEDLIDEVEAVVRARYREPGSESANSAPEYAARPVPQEPDGLATSLSMLFRNLLRAERRREPVTLLTWQPPVRIAKRNKTLIDRLSDIYMRWTLRANMILFGGRELIWYHSTPSIVWFPKGYYGYTRTCIPHGNIGKISIRDHAGFDGVKELVVTAGEREFIVPFEDSGAESVRRASLLWPQPNRF